MDTVFNHIRGHLLETAGVPRGTPKPTPSLESLRETEWNAEFEILMRNRLIMGAIRYGNLSDEVSYDCITSMRQRLDLLEVDGNGEHLVDIANICLVMFSRKDHPKFHFKAGDDTIHVERNDSDTP